MREKALKEVWLYDIINSDEFILGVSFEPPIGAKSVHSK